MSEAEAAAPAAQLDKIVEKYVQVRDKKAALEGDHKKKIAELDAVLDRIEAHLLKHLQTQGAESIRTAAGTFFVVEKVGVTVADWDAVLNFIREGEHWSMLEKRVSNKFVEAHQVEHNDVPPGIDLYREKSVNVRRA